MEQRKEHIKESFAKYVGTDEEIHVDDIPVIAFAGSGGGFRAMIGTTGKEMVFKEIQKSKKEKKSPYFSVI